MGASERRYRKILESQGYDFGRRGRPALPPLVDRAKALWRALKAPERAAWMEEAGLVPDPARGPVGHAPAPSWCAGPAVTEFDRVFWRLAGRDQAEWMAWAGVLDNPRAVEALTDEERLAVEAWRIEE